MHILNILVKYPLKYENILKALKDVNLIKKICTLTFIQYGEK